MCGRCARSCRARFPGMTFSFLPADIVSQILNFGAPAPIDLQIRGAEPRGQFRLCATSCCASCAAFRASPMRASSNRCNDPGFNVDVDRTRAQYVGVTERDVTNSMVVNLAGSQPGRADLLAQPGQRRVLFDRDADAAIPDRFAQRAAEPADHGAGHDAVADRSAASPTSSARPRSAVVSQYNIQPMVQIYATHAGARPRRGRRRRAEDPRRNGQATCRRARRSCCSARCRP